MLYLKDTLKIIEIDLRNRTRKGSKSYFLRTMGFLTPLTYTHYLNNSHTACTFLATNGTIYIKQETRRPLFPGN